MKILPVFNPELPKDLENLPINLLWRGTSSKVEFVGYRVKGEDGLPVEEIIDVNDTPEKAQGVIDDDIIPAIRKMFADELEEGKVKADVSKPDETVRSDLAQADPPKDAGRRRARHKA